ncbi:MAG: Na+/H+ antiporter subunit E [Austwickia sp.]|nr:Na+/H+ antiporter subunit E [Austwickia sp.]
MRIVAALAYVGFIVREVIVGSWQVTRAAWLPGGLYPPGSGPDGPAIVEFPLRCRSDLEISVLASSITITPGTMVLGIATAQGETPATFFVHVALGGTRTEILRDLRDMESRLLRATRGPDVDAGAGAGKGDDAGAALEREDKP